MLCITSHSGGRTWWLLAPVRLPPHARCLEIGHTRPTVVSKAVALRHAKRGLIKKRLAAEWWWASQGNLGHVFADE